MNLFLILALLTGVVADDFELPPDIVHGNLTRTGTLAGFLTGDGYTHAVIDQRGGGAESFWSFDPLLDYFLSLHVGETVVLQIEDVETWIMEEEGMLRLLRVVDAAAGDRTFEAWSDSLRAIGEPEDLLEYFHVAPSRYPYRAEEEEGAPGGNSSR